jgi:hypothetical protein
MYNAPYETCFDFMFINYDKDSVLAVIQNKVPFPTWFIGYIHVLPVSFHKTKVS